jgi:FKBP-type peptidyl-prolyl cis-trans isomerase 2
MRQAKSGDSVRVCFTGYLEDGAQFASTERDDPLELTLGEGKLIKCFEQSVIGMAAGERKTVRLQPSEALGERLPELVSQVPLHSFPEQDEDLHVGSTIMVKDDKGNDVKAKVTQLTDQEITIDANHPLSGEAITFDIELIEIK